VSIRPRPLTARQRATALRAGRHAARLTTLGDLTDKARGARDALIVELAAQDVRPFEIADASGISDGIVLDVVRAWKREQAHRAAAAKARSRRKAVA